MAVKVHIQRQSLGTVGVVDTYDNGNHVFVNDGHLFVSTSSGAQVRDTIATYTPGSWKHAEVLDS